MRSKRPPHTPLPQSGRALLVLALGLLAGLTASAQRLTAVAVAHTDILDTYLSQETFSGTEVSFISQAVRQRDSSRVSRELLHHAWVALAGTRGNAHSLLSGAYNLRFGWHYNWTYPAQRLRLRVGGMGDFLLGGAYDTRNSNNPAQLRLALSVDPSASLSWDFTVGRRPITLTYAAAMPLIGLAFSPHYGQSYYEIFARDNYDHNVVVTSPFSAPQLHQMLTLDIHFRRTALTVGYVGNILQMRANGLKYHQYSHGILLGWKY